MENFPKTLVKSFFEKKQIPYFAQNSEAVTSPDTPSLPQKIGYEKVSLKKDLTREKNSFKMMVEPSVKESGAQGR